MYKVVIIERAKYDVREAKLYYRAIRTPLAIAFQSELEKIIGKLSVNPLVFGHRSADNRVANVARFPYKVYYTVEGNTVFVLAVMHAFRNPDAIRARNS